MDLKSELLKSIWYAFTALDLEKSGKVSKSQLKVLSHNLYTVLNIPHDPTTLEDHFRDDNDGPVSSHGYMPYLNKYILDKVQDGNFAKERFNELCWTLTAKKNYKPLRDQGLISERDAFKLWCLFNFLSEDKYPLVVVQEEVGYLLKKLFMAMGQEWLHEEELTDYFTQDPSLARAVTVWQFLEMMESGRFTRSASKECLTLGIQSVYEELVLDVMQKGYMWKKGQVRRNWNERWFVLKASHIHYYVNENLKEKKGEIHLDMDSTVEVLPDKEGKRCLFCIKTANRTYELSASDTKRRQEWIDSVTAAIWICTENRSSLHKEQKERRREQRQQSACRKLEKRMEEEHLAELQQEKERQLLEIEQLRKAQEEAQVLWRSKELQWMKQQEMQQQKLQRELQKAHTDKRQMQLVMEQKELEAGAQRLRIQELETMQRGLEQALKAEIQAHTDEQTVRSAQARLLQEEEEKLKELMKLKVELQNLIQRTQQKQQLEQQITSKAQALQQAMEELRETRHRNKQNLVVAERRRKRASQYVKHWNVQLNRLMTPVMPGAAQNQPSSDILSHRGCGAFTPEEFSFKKTHQKTRPLDRNNDPKTSTQVSKETFESDSEDYENIEEYMKNVSLMGATPL
ncbi:differentially expressed in FDCP 6 homolog isoform X1 [Carcharodon carcharias]|uniref:differentially expressed in FDCP 6 homolog isoform X1 n=1 Tax=Carcharodon carcharias TaxID=13397 RepID=UPI001B7F0D97|nr:differentially expressed in FDCP 6 homolog isoform X1 [Carcharodon carcharias]